MTNNTQPSIEIIFKNLSGTAIQRGGKGKVALILVDNTAGTFTEKTYKSLDEVPKDATEYTESNLQAIKDVFLGVPSKVIVFKTNTVFTLQKALDRIKSMSIDWLGTNSTVAADQTAIVDFVKGQQALKKYIKAVVVTATNPDSKQVVNLPDRKVTFNDTRGESVAIAYVPTALGLLAGLPLNRSATFLQLTNLKAVEPIVDIDAEIKNGKLVIFNDDGIIKFSTAVTSLVSTDNTTEKLEMFTKLENVEIQNLTFNDIFNTFKNEYVGKGKNTVDRQYLFISAIKGYFGGLELQELLDPQHNNRAMIDVVEQRLAWKSIKGEEVDTWSDQQVINTPFKNKVFLAGDNKYLESTENLAFGITLF